MSEPLHHPLWLRFVHGEPLDRSERDALAEELASGQAPAEELVDDLLIDGALASLARVREDADGFGARFDRRLQEELGSIAFERQVRQRIVTAPKRPRSARSRRIALRRAGRTALVPWIVGVLATAAAVVIATMFWPGPRPQTAAQRGSTTIVGLTCPARAERGGGGTPLGEGSTVQAGDRVVTDSGGSLTIAFTDGTTLELDGGSSLILAAVDDDARRVDLGAGRVVARVARRRAGASFSVGTAHAVATVAGTVFAVAVDEGTTRLDVREGAVRFTDAATGLSTMVVAGGSAAAGPDARPAPEVAPRRPGPAEPGLPAPRVHWQFEEVDGATATDSSPHHEHGSILGDPLRIEGRTGRALRLDGIDDRVRCAARALPAPDGAQTVAAWIRYDAVPASAQVVVALSGRSSGVYCGFHRLEGDRVRLGAWRYGGPYLVSTEPPAVDAWHHVAYTFDGTTHVLYVDGAPVDRSTATPQQEPPTEFSVGGLPWNDEFFRGDVDDVRAYDRALGTAEVLRLSRAEPGAR